MTVDSASSLDLEPVDLFKPLYKRHKKYEWQDAIKDPHVLDTANVASYRGPYTISSDYDSQGIITIKQLPGLKILSGYITAEEQAWLIQYTLDELVPDVQRHKSNLTPLLQLPGRLDLFNDDLGPFYKKPPPSSNSDPKSSKTSTKTVSMREIREKQLRWITLGGQYDWTAKIYPTWERHSEDWPDFPVPLADFITKRLNTTTKKISSMVPEAAIVNFYSPGDTLSAHQDVAEKSLNDLISISIGCACIFYAGLTRYVTRDSQKYHDPLPILLHSGDIVIMGEESRQAYHGVSKVFKDTSPDFGTLLNEQHRDWATRKRLNINVRQMV